MSSVTEPVQQATPSTITFEPDELAQQLPLDLVVFRRRQLIHDGFAGGRVSGTANLRAHGGKRTTETETPVCRVA